ncbi:MAG: hypothetical protein HUJ93_04560 [Bacteroidales bacterium]|nr:hypothetical protein [Bacteroidales bacterium]
MNDILMTDEQLKMVNIYNYVVNPEDVDAHRNFRLTSLEGVLLNAAGRAADDRNFGAFELIDSEGVTWVLLKLAIEMEQIPKEKETITIKTWVEYTNRLLSVRNFLVYNQDGVVIGSASSAWSLIDISTRRPVDILSETGIEDHSNGVRVPASLPGKLRPEENPDAFVSHTVAYSDIDYNGHVNSMKYVQWMLDSYPVDRIYSRSVARFEIAYLHEAMHGQNVTVRHKTDGDQTFFSVRSDEGEDFVRARIFWK